MKYNEIIHVNEDFVPVFDLENEKESYWSYFIPNNKFRDVLTSVLNSLDSHKQKNPVWLQGTYGTGKSHATAVIKHLLCDEDALNSFNLGDNQLNEKLKKFKSKYKVFPVVLKGTSTIGDSRRFSFTIQSAVKKALKEKNMNISIPSEYENMLSIITDGPVTLKEEYLKDTTLEAFAIDEIVNRLKNEESEILIELENILMKHGVSPLTQETIHQWLKNVNKELKRVYDIDYLMIFWDEFTGALNLPNVDEILLQIQDIAESKNEGVSLFIVSHKTRTTQTNINQENIEKVMDRFERINYTMEPIATYELMAKSIKREPEWESEKNRFKDKITPLINKISENDGPNVKRALEELYPIHPYTAFLATFIAQYIGSTERSIFKFLHDDEEYGFKNFINTFDIDERYFLTSDYLWDFFIDDFDQIDDEKVNSAIQKYNMYYSILEKEGGEYLTIFKVILLLNILFKMVELTEGSLAIPSKENIFNIFIGSIYESKVEMVLNYIDEKGIINKTPDDLFELTTNSLPSEEISKEKDKLNQTLKLTDLLNTKQKSNVKEFISNKLNREMKIEFFDANIRENNLISKLEKNKGNLAYLQMYLFLCKNAKEYDSLKKNINSISEKGLLDNKIMIVSKASFDDKYLKKYLDYTAQAKVAKRHDYKEESERDEKYANKIIDSWINDIKHSYVEYYLNDLNETLLFSDFIGKVNKKLSKQIFYKGLENIDSTIKNRNLWVYYTAKVLSEKYITSKSYEELVQSLNNGPDKKSVEIFKDNNDNLIIDSKLNLTGNVPENHPVKLLQEFVDDKLQEAQPGGKFNLGNLLKPLTETPFGYYTNRVNIAAISYVFRKYVNKLYDNDGQPVDETKMKNKIISLFTYWEKGKKEQELYVRFGSEDEKKLIILLNDIFNLGLDVDRQSINNVRWSIREWLNNNNTPLWLFKYSSYMNADSEEALKKLTNLLQPDNLNIPDELIQTCYASLDPVTVDFKLLIKEDKNKLFERLILDIDDSVSKEKIPMITEYIIEQMPEDVNNWESENIFKVIHRWIVKDSKTQYGGNEGVPGTPASTGGDVSVPGTSGGEKHEDDSAKILNKVKNMDANKLKNILIQALEEHHEIQTILDDYLEF